MLTNKQIERMLSKLQRFETTLEPLLFQAIGQAPMSKFHTDRQWHVIPEDALFEASQPGDRYQGEGTYCWFKGSYTVPPQYEGKSLYIRPHIEGYEAMLWVNGKPFGTFCSKIVVTGHGNHYCDLLKQNVAANEQIEIALEYYAGHYVKGCMPFEEIGHRSYDYEYNGVDICLMNEEVSDFLFDLKTLNQLASSLDENSFRRANVVNALAEVHKVLYYSFENVDNEVFYEALRQAAPILKEVLKATNSASAPFAGLIGHSHMDTVWLWHRDETIKKCARTYSNQISLMERYPEYKFIQSSSYHTEMIRKHYPDLFEDIRQKVEEGRYEPNGAVWVECDCNLTGGESLIRQFLWGQRYTREHFNYTSNAFWLPDTFGYSAAIPQIMKGFGVDYFLTTKLSWNDTTPFPYETFYWKGIDGTEVLTHFNRTHIWPDAESLIDFVVDGKKHNDPIREKTVNNMRLISYGFGDGGGGPQFEMIEMARRVQDLEGVPRSAHVTAGEFMKELERTIVNPSTHTGELYLQLHRGTLTNQHNIKRNNRKAEFLLRDLEYVTVQEAVRAGQVASDEGIRPLMEILLVNQFHDTLPGTSIPRAHDQTHEEMAELFDKGGQLLLERVSVQQTEKTVSVINTLSFTRRDTVYLDIEGDQKVEGAYAQQVFEDLQGNRKLALSGLEIPAFSSVSLKLTDGKPEGESPFVYTEGSLETPFASIQFDSQGYLSSFIDKRNGRELKGSGLSLNTFLMAEDVPNAWDSWDIDADIELKLAPAGELLSRQIVADGPAEFRLRSEYRVSPKSTVKQDMIFFADSPEVRFETLMDWQDDHRLLKTAFSTSIHTGFVRQEVQFGYLCRPTTRNTSEEKAMFEVLNHKYSDLSENRYGVALLNDCKYGISVEGGEMRLTLHKGGVRPDYRGDKGLHECTYSFYPHDEGFGASSVIHPAYELNSPPVIVQGQSETHSLALVEADNIIIETVKPCEDAERAFILRLYEAEGTYTRTKLKLAAGTRADHITNMLEEPVEALGGKEEAELTFRPFEIKTVKVTY
ncbi:alpha-mannosidase [Paenibacillus sp. GCM10012307]|uniref:Alpha-mannosidase n=1 Tax=Paenibacillus roseus TaxID=2798579 RepID=A0A934JC17_9BACL|nr:glycoside hydrolase family 38 C-terminal domain-containing protein [Paenibacillus roseus]MBJ6364297.1 alpha-mannosidase [Paenibacillus roseus]